MTLYNRWKRRAYVRIINLATVANYQHRLTVAWYPGMRSDFRDLRFTTISGKKCYFWIETYTSKTSAAVWIKVPAASQSGLIMYYGNGQAVSESSGVNTFDLFDDFLGAALDTGKWTATGSGSVSVSGGIASITSTAGSAEHIQANTGFGTNYAYRWRGQIPQTTAQSGYSGASNNALVVYGYMVAGNYNAYTYNGSEQNTNLGNSLTGYRTWEICRNGSTSNIFKSNDSTIATMTSNVPTGTGYAHIRANATAGGTTNTVDWFLIRKFQATEPTLAIVWRGVNPSFGQKSVIATFPSGGHNYVFDPVNVDHGMTAGAGAQEVAMGAININHGMSPGIGVVEYDLGVVNIYHAMYPTATWAQIIDPVVDSGYLIGVTVSQSMDDAMAEAVFEYDTDAIGNYFSGDYMTQVHVNVPDYLGVSNCVFVGLIPSSRGTYDVAKDKMTMRAVDYGIFLAKQTFDIKDLSLLPPDDQTTEGANVAKVLSYRNRVKPLYIGMTIRGEVSNATGTINSIAGTSGQILTLYPATGVFVDGENLSVGGVIHAIADGRSIDVPYTPYYHTIGPEDWVRSVLGGENWMRTSGIEPKELESSSGYWNTSDCPAVPFMFGSLEKKRDGLIRLAKYMGYMWHIKPRNIGTGSYRASGYFIKETSIDTLLGLPAAASITSLDSFTAPITIDQDGEMQVDVVKVRCQDLQGNWLDAIRSNSYYDAGEGPYREFSDEPKDIATQTDLNEYATDMYNLYAGRSVSWTGTLLARSDLQLYQKLNISGCIEGGVPNGTYRIIKISHEYGCAKNLTHITFMLSSAFSILRKYGMTYKDSISKVEQIVDGLKKKEFQIELGYVKTTDGWSITYETEAGNKGKGRDGTSTKNTAGGIPVGAKIQIQESRGGVICIPVVPASGGSTDLLTVGVPVIVSATVDPTNANYWILNWTPGANNQNVSINFQTTGYPSARGVVLPYGNPASCRTQLVPVSIHALRIRFSGPLTTYYIRLWGEKNGQYSATSAQASITSGSTVTPITESEEPEPFLQRASMSMLCNTDAHQWFNGETYLFPAGTYKLEGWGWQRCYVPPPEFGWVEDGGVPPGQAYRCGVFGFINLLVGTSVDAALWWLHTQTFNYEATYSTYTFTVATPSKIGVWVNETVSHGATSGGSVWLVLTQLS